MTEEAQGRRKIILVSAAIALQVLLSALDTTIIGTAMPTVVAAPIAGKLCDVYGRRRYCPLGAWDGLQCRLPSRTHTRMKEFVGTFLVITSIQMSVSQTLVGFRRVEARRAYMLGLKPIYYPKFTAAHKQERNAVSHSPSVQPTLLRPPKQEDVHWRFVRCSLFETLFRWIPTLR